MTIHNIGKRVELATHISGNGKQMFGYIKGFAMLEGGREGIDIHYLVELDEGFFSANGMTYISVMVVHSDSVQVYR